MPRPKPGEPDRQVAVNRYLWQASLDVLSFLPIEGADPFSGLLVTGWGRVASDGGVYRVTVYISDPALDASALLWRLHLRGVDVVRHRHVVQDRSPHDALLRRPGDLARGRRDVVEATHLGAHAHVGQGGGDVVGVDEHLARHFGDGDAVNAQNTHRTLSW